MEKGPRATRRCGARLAARAFSSCRGARCPIHRHRSGAKADDPAGQLSGWWTRNRSSFPILQAFRSIWAATSTRAPTPTSSGTTRCPSHPPRSKRSRRLRPGRYSRRRAQSTWAWLARLGQLRAQLQGRRRRLQAGAREAAVRGSTLPKHGSHARELGRGAGSKAPREDRAFLDPRSAAARAGPGSGQDELVHEIKPASRLRTLNRWLLVLVPIVVLATAAWRYREHLRQGYPLIVEKGKLEGIPALEAGEFDKAHHLLSEARSAVDALGGAIQDADDIRQAAQEAAIYVYLLPEDLGKLLSECVGRSRTSGTRSSRAFTKAVLSSSAASSPRSPTGLIPRSMSWHFEYYRGENPARRMDHRQALASSI